MRKLLLHLVNEVHRGYACRGTQFAGLLFWKGCLALCLVQDSFNGALRHEGHLSDHVMLHDVGLVLVRKDLLKCFCVHRGCQISWRRAYSLLSGQLG